LLLGAAREERGPWDRNHVTPERHGGENREGGLDCPGRRTFISPPGHVSATSAIGLSKDASTLTG